MKNKKPRRSLPVERPRFLLRLTLNSPLSLPLPTNSVLHFRTPEKQMIKAEPQALMAVRPFSITRVDLTYLYSSGLYSRMEIYVFLMKSIGSAGGILKRAKYNGWKSYI